MSCLARWRLRSGAQLLSSTNWSVARIALEVGYESEAAFNRAFKRELGSPPARFRNLARTAREVSEGPDTALRGPEQPVITGDVPTGAEAFPRTHRKLRPTSRADRLAG
jgi:hypothetical protein